MTSSKSQPFRGFPAGAEAVPIPAAMLTAVFPQVDDELRFARRPCGDIDLVFDHRSSRGIDVVQNSFVTILDEDLSIRADLVISQSDELFIGSAVKIESRLFSSKFEIFAAKDQSAVDDESIVNNCVFYIRIHRMRNYRCLAGLNVEQLNVSFEPYDIDTFLIGGKRKSRSPRQRMICVRSRVEIEKIQ